MPTPGARRPVAVVTGGAAGIGRATALRLAEDCGAVAVVDVAAAGPAVAAEVEAAGCPSRFYEVDVADGDAVATVAADIVLAFGDVGVLVNCAGVHGPEATVVTVDEADLRRVLEINFFGAFHWCRAVVPAMVEQGWGRIVSVTSHSRHGQELRAPYATSKAALSALTRSLALEVARFGVLANSIDPGRTLTDMVVPRFSEDHLADPPDSPIGRYAAPEEIAEAIAFLCSERCSFAAGATFNVSGGAI
jgi:3-oxoacyl-[acyl-carrier protein] reductase